MHHINKDEFDSKKDEIKKMTTAESLKQEFLDLFNRDKHKPPINNASSVKIPRKSKKKILFRQIYFSIDC